MLARFSLGWLRLLTLETTFAFATTPLHEAVVKINRKKVRALIISGIDINARDSGRNDPARYGKNSGRYFCGNAVREQEQINMVERENNKRIIEMLTEAGAKE